MDQFTSYLSVNPLQAMIRVLFGRGGLERRFMTIRRLTAVREGAETLRFTVLTLLLLLVGGLASAQDAVREWTDAEGRKVRAALVGFKDEATVKLQLEDGRIVDYPVGKLSAADAAYAREQGGKASGSSAVDWQNPKVSPDFVVRGLRRQNVPGFISTSNGWKWQLKSVEATLEYKGSADRTSASVKAYFYDRTGKLIEQFDTPPKRQDKDRNYVTTPEFFLKGKTVEVYYPITDFHETSGLATVLVVFGSDNEFTAATMPKTSFEFLDFAEKAKLFPDWNPQEGGAAIVSDGSGGSKSDAASSSVDSLEIRRLREVTHPYAIVFDGRYRSRMLCLTAEVRAKGPISPAPSTVKLYAFDDQGHQTAFRARPSTASLGGNNYVGLPNIADESWHPVFFALDGDLQVKYPTYLLVFQFGGKTTAMVKSSTGMTIESLDFPEKAELKSAP